MKNVSVRLKIIFLTFALLFTLTFNSGNIADAQRGRCGDETPCLTGEIFDNCLPLPTTLPAVSTTWSGGYGFIPASSNCGARKCYWLFACRCGPPLAGGFCAF